LIPIHTVDGRKSQEKQLVIGRKIVIENNIKIGINRHKRQSRCLEDQVEIAFSGGKNQVAIVLKGVRK
jgi:hypothetical protein